MHTLSLHDALPICEASFPEWKKVAITRLSKSIPVENVDYLAPEDKQPGNITVKDISKSQRGKGFALQEIAKTGGVIGVGGIVSEQAGALEPTINFFEKYSWNVIAFTFIGLMALSVVLYYLGTWLRQKGEDEATDLLG